MSENAVEKEALLYTFGFIEPSFKELKESYGEIENILMKYCFPELTSTTGALRAWASWVFGEYANILQNVELKVEVAVKGYENLLVNELPIRVTAATSLHKLLAL